MPINKPAAISAAVLLAVSSVVQAQTDFDFNRIPAAERQRMLQEAVAELNGKLPSTSYDGSNQLNRVFIENNRLVFDGNINLDKLNTPPEARRPEILQALFQVSGSKQLCEISEIAALNKQLSITARYQVHGSQQIIPINVPKGYCTRYLRKPILQRVEEFVIDNTTIMTPVVNQKLPIQNGNITLMRLTFDVQSRTQHRYISKADSSLAMQPNHVIRTRLQQEAEQEVCDPFIAPQNRYYATTFHITLPGHATPFEITIPKGHCDRQR